MKIESLALAGMRGWPDLELSTLSRGINVVFGPSASGKTTLAEFLAHALYGKMPRDGASEQFVPDGEAIVEQGASRYRLRRYHDGTAVGRLTVASLGREPVDRETVQRLLGDVPPAILTRHFAVGFGASALLSDPDPAEFARDYQLLSGRHAVEPGRRTTELAARRDALAYELETRIAAERRASGELEERRRELAGRIREAEQSLTALELRLRTVETALAETDARLRYRRLELNVELRWHSTEPADWEPELAELDDQIARWRATLADLARREADVRGKLAQLGAATSMEVTHSDERAWMAVARQLAADLEGEVARLARATASQKCICHDAHPRLRPIVETLARQLEALEALHGRRQQSDSAVDWTAEAEHLTRSQAELQRQLDHLLDRRQVLVGDTPSRRRAIAAQIAKNAQADGERTPYSARSFSAADAEQLEQRRLELEQERFELVEKIRNAQVVLRGWRSQRGEADRQRAGLLSARSIEHIQRELAAVQRKLERIANGRERYKHWTWTSDDPWRASDYLAQLTDGRLVRLELDERGGRAWAVRQSGGSSQFEDLSPAERDQVRLAFCLALVSAAGRKGAQLPLLLDDPFANLDARDTAALAAVLDELGRNGQQVLVFTRQPSAVERLESLGGSVHELTRARRWNDDRPVEPVGALPAATAVDVRGDATAPRRPRIAASKRSAAKTSRRRANGKGGRDAA